MARLLLGALDFELGAGELISEIDHLQLPRVDIEDGSYEDVLQLQGSVLATLEEDPLILDVELSGARSTISMLRSFRK